MREDVFARRWPLVGKEHDAAAGRRDESCLISQGFGNAVRCSLQLLRSNSAVEGLQLKIPSSTDFLGSKCLYPHLPQKKRYTAPLLKEPAFEFVNATQKTERL